MSQVAMRKEESEGSAAELPVTVYTPDSLLAHPSKMLCALAGAGAWCVVITIRAPTLSAGTEKIQRHDPLQ